MLGWEEYIYIILKTGSSILSGFMIRSEQIFTSSIFTILEKKLLKVVADDISSVTILLSSIRVILSEQIYLSENMG